MISEFQKKIFYAGQEFLAVIQVDSPFNSLYDNKIIIYDSNKNVIGRRMKSTNSPIDLVDFITEAVNDMKLNELSLSTQLKNEGKRLLEWNGVL